MAAALIALPFRPTINLQGGIEPGATLEVFQSGGLTPVTIYSDEALTTPLSNPLTADAVGAFPAVYFNDATAIRVRLKTAAGVTLNDTDPYVATAAEAEAILDDAAAIVAAASTSATNASNSAIAAAASASAASDSADDAAASAASAVLAPGTSATSTTSNTIGTGSKSFTIQTGKQFVVGQFVVAAQTSAPTNFMFGQVTAHDSGTGAFTMDSQATNGSGTITDWTIALSGPSGSVGAVDLATDVTGTLAIANGGTGATSAANARTNLGLGTIATQAASNVAITGGSITGITDLAVADGGTGASTAADARTNLGLGTIATQAANNVSLTGGSISGMTSIADSIGNVRRLVKSAETSGTLTTASANQLVRATAGVTVPASVFSANDSIFFINKSGGAITITQGGGLTMTNTSGSTGNRTLANNGVATVWFNSATDAHIFGEGLT